MTRGKGRVANYTNAEKHDRQLMRALRKAYPDEKSDNAMLHALCNETGMNHRTAQRVFREGKSPPDYVRFLLLHFLIYKGNLNA